MCLKRPQYLNFGTFYVFQAFLFAHIMWIAPLHLAVVTYLVYLEVDWCAFLMTACICLQIPLQLFLAKYFAKLRYVCMHAAAGPRDHCIIFSVWRGSYSYNY